MIVFLAGNYAAADFHLRRMGVNPHSRDVLIITNLEALERLRGRLLDERDKIIECATIRDWSSGMFRDVYTELRMHQRYYEHKDRRTPYERIC